MITRTRFYRALADSRRNGDAVGLGPYRLRWRPDHREYYAGNMFLGATRVKAWAQFEEWRRSRTLVVYPVPAPVTRTGDLDADHRDLLRLAAPGEGAGARYRELVTVAQANMLPANVNRHVLIERLMGLWYGERWEARCAAEFDDE